MRTLMLTLGAAVAIASPAGARAQVNPTDPQPTCNVCPGTYVPLAELDAYLSKARAERLIDQQVRDIDIGRANIGSGMVWRGKLDKPRADEVAEHDVGSGVDPVI